MSDKERVAELVSAINECWTSGRYDELTNYFHGEMVLAMPGFDRRVDGAAPIIDSYRQFGQTAAIRSFNAEPPTVDVVGQTAVAISNFELDYALEGMTYRDRGADLLVFHNDNGEWRVVWRTVIVSGSEQGQ